MPEYRLGDDTITSTNSLQIELGFEDDDFRKINYPNPRADITSSEMAVFDSYIINNQIVIGDKTGASSTGINFATIVEQTKTQLALE